MIDLKLGPDGDLELAGADIASVDGAEEVAQGLKLALRSVKGEYILDQRAGLDLFGLVLGKSVPVLRDAEIKREILATPDVAELRAYSAIQTPDRELIVTLEAVASDGTLIKLGNQRIFVPTAGEPPEPPEPPDLLAPLPVSDLDGAQNWIWQPPNIALQAAPPLGALGSTLPVKSTEGP